MPKRVDLFDSTYGHFIDRVLYAIRKETFGVDRKTAHCEPSWKSIE